MWELNDYKIEQSKLPQGVWEQWFKGNSAGHNKTCRHLAVDGRCRFFVTYESITFVVTPLFSFYYPTKSQLTEVEVFLAGNADVIYQLHVFEEL